MKIRVSFVQTLTRLVEVEVNDDLDVEKFIEQLNSGEIIDLPVHKEIAETPPEFFDFKLDQKGF